MSSAQGLTSAEWDRLAELEKGLLQHLEAAEGELQRAEDLDEEQRAEIHAILQALRRDGEDQTAIIRSLCGDAGHA